ncbi:hypothetical protein SEA_ORLA_71 [Gordonia phage Orla]|nr:hypothetical protein SEA_ORLA_71 [Gordonia phage Orla]
MTANDRRERVRERKNERTLANAHPGLPGRTLQDKIRDKARSIIREGNAAQLSKHEIAHRPALVTARNRGRIEGMAIALAILRGTTARAELERIEADDD